MASRETMRAGAGTSGETDIEKTHSKDLPATSSETNSSDDNVVDWEGPEDPENPMLWSKAKKNAHIIIIGFFTLVA
jgi:hypothetical protein